MCCHPQIFPAELEFSHKNTTKSQSALFTSQTHHMGETMMAANNEEEEQQNKT